MTEDLPLGHPAREPDAATEDRVRARVGATVRRRRARRRVLTALPVVAVVALVVTAIVVANTRDHREGKDRQVVTAGPGDAELAFEPDVEWDDAVLSADGKTLKVTAGRILHDPRGCQLEVLHDVVETDDAVTIGLQDATAPEDAAPLVCADLYTPPVVEVALERPLGERAVYDGVRPEARTVLPLADLVQVTYVPAGFTTDPDDIPAGEANVQQTFNAEGADWYFAVNETTGPPPSDLPGATSAPIMVNDIEGVRITGQMNNTMESIRFPLGDRTVTVWGEMQGPPTFTHADELRKIAEGIRLPERADEDPAPATTSVPADATPTTGAPEDTAPGREACPRPEGSATDLEGQPDWTNEGWHSWRDRSGCPVRVDVLSDGPGPAHCGQEDADLLVMSDRLGERYPTPTYTAVSYVRDPLGVFDLPEVTAAFDPDATLPSAAVDTGYHRDGIELHVDPADPSAVWLAYPDGHVEQWPLADLPPCA